VRRTDPPPWLIGGDGFGMSGLAPSAGLAQDQVDSGIHAAPPDREDLLAVKREASFWRRAPKVIVPMLVMALAVTAAVLLWPRPTPLAMLDIRSHPPGATVIVDGARLEALTPTKVTNLEVGSVHSVELRLDGFMPWTQPVELSSEEVRQIAVLSPIRGTLRVTSEPRGASVFIDGMYQGSAPVEVEGLDINRGVEVQCRYEDQTQSQAVEWQGRTEAAVNFSFETQPPRRRYR
jgi:hypothetical protein